MGGETHGTGRERLALGALLLASAAVFAWGLEWGLPGAASWAPDEIVPAAVLEGMSRGFAGAWHEKYPPLHYYVLASVSAPVLATLGQRPSDPLTAEATLRLASVHRGVSVAMALGTLLAVFLVGRRVGPTGRAGLVAAALVAVMPPFAFYAKLANVDAAHLFWWAWSLYFLVRTLEDHRLHDYLLLAATAAAAIGTKDQAYGLYVLVPAQLAVARMRDDRMKEAARRPASGAGTRLLRATLNRTILLAGAMGLALLAAIYNLPANLDGMKAHVDLITGAASRDFREFPATPMGQIGLFASTIRHLVFVMGLPAFAAALAGVAAAVAAGRAAAPSRSGECRVLSLLVPAVSYYVFFMAVVLYVYDRFLLPIAIVLCVVAGRWLAGLMARGGNVGRAAATATAVVLVWGLGRALSVDAQMAFDARYDAEGWLKANARNGLVGAIGPAEYLPRLDGLKARPLGPSLLRLERARPDFVVLNADHALRADPGSGEEALYRSLEDGSLGYERAFAYRFEPWWRLVRTEDFVERTGKELRSNLGKVNPEIRVYRRR